VPPVGWSLVAWFAVAPMLIATRDRPWTIRAAAGSLGGVVWGLGTVGWWLIPALRNHLGAGTAEAAMMTIAATWLYAGVYLAVFALVYPWLGRPRWLAAAAVWVLLESLRGRLLGGMPWAHLGHALAARDHLSQIADVAGVAGLSLLPALAAAAAAERGRARWTGLTITAVLVVAATGYGRWRLDVLAASARPERGVSMQVVSGLHPQADRVAAYAAATRAGFDLVIWPETAVPGHLQDDPAAAATVARVARAHRGLLLGSPRWDGRGDARRYYNAAWLVDSSGTVRTVYDKRRLVPFAERAPIRAFELLRRPFAPGANPEPLDVHGLRLGVLVCWEALFGDLAAAYARGGADVLVNLTSDEGLGGGAAQMLAFSRLRAIETRRWLLRASGTGASVAVDPLGRLLEITDLALAPGRARPDTIHTRHGGWIPAVLVVIVLVAQLRGGVRTARRG